MGRVNSLAHFVYGENPDNWTEAVWIERVGQLSFVLNTVTDIIGAGVGRGIATAMGGKTT